MVASSIPTAATSPANTPNTASDARNESTGNQASDLSDLRTAHDRLAISHEVWNRVMPPVSAIREAEVKARPSRSVRLVTVHAVPRIPARRFHAPGRVNLIGDHTDYNGGFVLPMAIDRGCIAVSDADGTGRLRVHSVDVAGRAELATDGSTDPATVEPAWARFVAGVVRAVVERGGTVPGGTLTVTSTVPIGSGLSSSSALTVASRLGAHHARRLGSSTVARWPSSRSTPRSLRPACPAG